jgi:hypothetical protein
MSIRLALPCLLGLAACAAGSHATAGEDLAAASRGGSGTIIERDQLRNSGPLLDVLIARIGNVSVGLTADCPRIVMRGNKSITQPSDPRIYVNGSPAGDTCILQLIRTDDVERVELYPMGVTARPGYRSNAGGLILVFMRDGTGEGG